MKIPVLTVLVSLCVAAGCAEVEQTDNDGGTVDMAALDAVFADFAGDDGPGCAVAVSRDGQQVMTRAFGMANLEWDIPNTGETVFEPGSVSKQFTAAATVLLALDGTISFDDDIRQYIPELPDYGEPITVRMLLNHTSGLRDWGSIAAIGGWPRTTRVHTHEHMLDIASRQRALNYEPGEYYSYTNTGYNLQAVMIERVTGMSFEEFSQERIFKPLGMTKTQWRDDFTEIVENRSVGYARGEDDEWHMLMPFENVHGNGGLLTTVGDLLKFTHNLDTGEVGGPEFLEEMHRQGVLDSGLEIQYASGLFVSEYKGVREVSHSGGTAAYRGFLTRFPDHGVAVSLMCNAGGANPGLLAHEVADLFLADELSEDSGMDLATNDIASGDIDAAHIAALAGGYRDTRNGRFMDIEADGATLKVEGRPLIALSETRFVSPDGNVTFDFESTPMFDHRPAAVFSTPSERAVRIEPVLGFAPSSTDLAEYAGAYHSAEAEVTYWVEAADGALAINDRYGEPQRAEPAYPDAFRSRGTMFIFHRNQVGEITEASLSQGRVWDLRFQRLP